MRKLSNEDFIVKAIKVHGNHYDYSKVNYVNAKTKITIICPIHGEFEQLPYSHLNGSGCPFCYGSFKSTDIDFIKKSNKVHNNKYDYSKVNYINNNTKVIIICPEHGEFEQKPSNHIMGQGCPKCKSKKNKERQTKTNKKFIEESINVHGDFYDYSKTVYVNSLTKVCIICPEHGEFWQTPSAHINNKQGCPICGRLKASASLRLTQEDFLNKSKIVHGDKYDYSQAKYIDYYTPVKILCSKHGEFYQTPDSHLQGKGCKMCGSTFSNGENEIRNFLINNIGIDNFSISDRNIIKPYELDFLIPNKNIAIEFNGIKWHSDEYKDKLYHLNKTKECIKKGVKLIHVFEDEFYNSKDIVFNKLLHILGIQNDLPKIYGRKCIIKKIDKISSESFLNMFHIQGYASSTLHYGAYYNNELIAVMSFKKINKNTNNWELTRFASDYNYICCGVGGKLFKHFIREHSPKYIKSFADRRWTVDEENNIYCQLGFKFDGYTKPDYRYVVNGIIKRQHKFNFRKEKLLKKYPDILNASMTEDEMTKKLGYYKIYDCGLIRYVWRDNLLK